MNEHEKKIRELKEKKIMERSFSFMNEDGLIEDLGTDHFTAPVHMLRICPEFRRYCQAYKVQPVRDE